MKIYRVSLLNSFYWRSQKGFVPEETLDTERFVGIEMSENTTGIPGIDIVWRGQRAKIPSAMVRSIEYASPEAKKS